MSFAMTVPQVRARTKTVTRRLGWWFLRPGDHVRAVEKAMGLRKGEKTHPLATIRIVSTRPEPLAAITLGDVAREGFPGWSTDQFIQMLVERYRVDPNTTVNRIEFEYLPEGKEAAETLARVIHEVAEDLAACGADEWGDITDMLNGTVNNIKHDFGDALTGNPSLFMRRN